MSRWARPWDSSSVGGGRASWSALSGRQEGRRAGGPRPHWALDPGDPSEFLPSSLPAFLRGSEWPSPWMDRGRLGALLRARGSNTSRLFDVFHRARPWTAARRWRRRGGWAPLQGRRGWTHLGSPAGTWADVTVLGVVREAPTVRVRPPRPLVWAPLPAAAPRLGRYGEDEGIRHDMRDSSLPVHEGRASVRGADAWSQPGGREALRRRPWARPRTWTTRGAGCCSIGWSSSGCPRRRPVAARLGARGGGD